MNALKQTLTESIAVDIVNSETKEIIDNAESIGSALRKAGIYNKKPLATLLSKKKNGERRVMYSSKYKLNIYLKYATNK